MSELIMKLKKVYFEGYRSLEEVTLHNLDRINILIGPNEGGKSNVFKAIEWGFSDKMLQKEDIPSNVRGRLNRKRVIMKALFEINTKKLFLEKIEEEIYKEIRENIKENLRERIRNYLKKTHFVKFYKLSDGSKQTDLLTRSMEEIPKSTIDEINNELKALYIRSDLSFLKEEIQTILKDAIQNAIKQDIGDINVPNLSKINATIMNDQHIIQIKNHLTTTLTEILKQIQGNKPIGSKQDFNIIINAWNTFISNIKMDHFSSNKITTTIKDESFNTSASDLFKITKKRFFSVFDFLDIEKICQKCIKSILPEVVFLTEEMEFKNEIEKDLTGGIIIDETSPSSSIHSRFFDIYDLDINDFNKSSSGEQRVTLDEILDELSNEIQRKWKQEKLRFECNVSGEAITFYIVDTDDYNKKIRKTFPESRSRGFKWYLAYLITLKYIHKRGNSILLLDDPAVFLHEKGQKDFLATLEEVGETNQVFYSTHLVSLYDEKRLERILLVRQDSNNKSTGVIKPWASTGRIAIEPVHHSLGIDRLIFQNVDKIIFVEGISDKFILEGIQAKIERMEGFLIYPISGGGKYEKTEIIQEINLLKCIYKYKEVDKYFFFDGDKQGEIKKEFKETDNQGFLSDVEFFGNENQEIEDLIETRYYLDKVLEFYLICFSDKKNEYEKIRIITEKIILNPKITQITKLLEKEFRKEKLGGFSKVDVSILIKRDLISKVVSMRKFVEITKCLKRKKIA